MMELAAVVADATSILGIAQLAVQVGEDVTPFVTSAYNILVNKTAMSDDQRASLLAQETALRAQLNQEPLSTDAL